MPSYQLQILEPSALCTYYFFDNNFDVEQKISKYSKEGYEVYSEQHFSYKHFLKNVLHKKTLPKLSWHLRVLQVCIG